MTLAAAVPLLLVLGVAVAGTIAPTAAPTAAPSEAPTAAPSQHDPNAFNIRLLAGPGTPPVLQAAMKEAARRWESIIVADVPDVPAFADLDCLSLMMPTEKEVAAQQALLCETAADWLLSPPEGALAAGPVDDILIAYMVNPALSDLELAISAPLTRRPTALDEHQRVIASFIAVNPTAIDVLERAGMLVPALMHEMAHSLGLGTNWPTLNGCGDKAACFASIQDDPAAPVGYADGATGVCYADVEFQKAEPGERLLETTEPNPGSNCGHWAESQLYGEILSTAAINKGAAVLPAFRGKPRLHVTSVTAGGLEDLGYEVNYDSEWIEPFDAIYARRRRRAASRLRQL